MADILSSDTSLPLTSLYINGTYRPASTNATFAVTNSYTGRVVGHSASASSSDCVEAIEAAHRAFPAWDSAPLAFRRDVLLRTAAILEGEEWKEKAMRALKEETSSTEGWALMNVLSGPGSLRNVAGMVNELKGDTFPSINRGGKVFVQRRGQGVVFSIIPWNGPVTLTARGVAIPLICGNTVVCRPSEYSPRIIGLMVDAFHQAGLPAGVLNFVPMSREDSPTLIQQFIAHPLVRKITFTGSDRVGRIIAAEAGRHLKPCLLELGGKAPAIILEDANIEDAARSLIFGGLLNSGQICMSTERIIVLRPALSPLLTCLKAHISHLKLGSPFDPSNHLSALFTEASAENVVRLLRDARDNGAELIVGDATREGAMVRPHLVVGVRPGMELWERESFGPILAIAVVDTVEEAVELANDSEYSLVSSLWTTNVHKAFEVGSRIRAGSVNINGTTMNSEAGEGQAGLGGSSGYGKFNVENFTDRRSLILHAEHESYPFMGLS